MVYFRGAEFGPKRLLLFYFFFLHMYGTCARVHPCERKRQRLHFSLNPANSTVYLSSQTPKAVHLMSVFVFFFDRIVQVLAGMSMPLLCCHFSFVRFSLISHTQKKEDTSEQQNTGKHICHFIPFNNPCRLTCGFWLCDKHRPLTIPIFRKTLEDKCSLFVYATHIHHFQPGEYSFSHLTMLNWALPFCFPFQI